jgi:hypothetical protein
VLYKEGTGTIVPTVVSGRDFTAMLDAEGYVWVWGSNTYGVLGQGNVQGSQGFTGYNAGGVDNLLYGSMNGIWDPSGNVDPAHADAYAHAWDMQPTLTEGVSVATPNPQRVRINGGTYLGDQTIFQGTDPDGKEIWIRDPITTIAAGEDHMVALTRSGKVYTWGRDHKGQLGLGKTYRCQAGRCTAARTAAKCTTAFLPAAGARTPTASRADWRAPTSVMCLTLHRYWPATR